MRFSINALPPGASVAKSAKQWLWLFIVLHVTLWTVLPVLLRPTLPIDAMEGVVWGQHLILGYDRNPWLNAWLTRLAIAIGGDSGWLTYLFSQLFVALCFWSVWRLGRKVLTPLHALTAVLILEGIQYYTIASIDFNDNVIELGLWPLLILLFYRAVTLGKLADWIGVGIVAGLALMTKYYAAFLLIGFLLFLLTEPQARQAFNKKGIYIAAVVFLIIIAPHFVWLFQHNFVTLHYAQNRVEKRLLLTYWGHVKPTLRFAGNQLLNFAGALVLFSALLWRRLKTVNLAPKIAVRLFDKRFFWIIAATPLVLTLLLALVLGWQLYALWGTPLLSLWGILLLIYTQPAIDQRRFHYFIMAVFVVLLSIAAGYTILLKSPGKKATVNYPAQTVAQTVEALWRTRYHQPLQYIAGDRYTTFYVSVYSKDKPAAYVDWDPVKSPWIDEQALRKAGAIFVQPVMDGDAFPPAVLQRFPALKVQAIMRFKRKNVTADTPPVILLIGLLPPERNH